ncbi:MAG: hypothetical protein AAFV51_12245 [Pseudomonadota bacterium]
MSESEFETPVRFSAHGPRGVKALERLAEIAFAERERLMAEREGSAAVPDDFNEPEARFHEPVRPEPVAVRRATADVASSRNAALSAAPAGHALKTPTVAALVVLASLAVALFAAVNGTSLAAASVEATFKPFEAAAAWRSGAYDAASARVAGGFPVHALLAHAPFGAEPGASLAIARACLLALLAPVFALALSARLSRPAAFGAGVAASAFVVFAPLAIWPAGLALALTARALGTPSDEPGVPLIDAAAAGALTALLAALNPLLAAFAIAARLNGGFRSTEEKVLAAGLEVVVALAVFGAVFFSVPGIGTSLHPVVAPNPFALGAVGLIAAAAALAGIVASENRAVVSGGGAAGALAFAFGAGPAGAGAFWLATALAGLAPRRRAGRRRSEAAGGALALGLAAGFAASLAAPMTRPAGDFALAGLAETTMTEWVERGLVTLDEARATGVFTLSEEFAALKGVVERVKAAEAEGRLAALLAPKTVASAVATMAHLEDARMADVIVVPRFGPDAGPESAAELKEAVGGVLYTEFRRVEETPLVEVWVRRERL